MKKIFETKIEKEKNDVTILIKRLDDCQKKHVMGSTSRLLSSIDEQNKQAKFSTLLDELDDRRARASKMNTRNLIVYINREHDSCRKACSTRYKISNLMITCLHFVYKKNCPLSCNVLWTNLHCVFEWTLQIISLVSTLEASWVIDVMKKKEKEEP